MAIPIRHKTLLAVLVCAIHIFAFVQAVAANEPDFIEVSLVSLIATPEKYDGKHVLVKGVAYLDQRYSLYAVYLTRDDKRAANDKNGVYLILAQSLGKVDRLNDKYVMARGRFSAEQK